MAMNIIPVTRCVDNQQILIHVDEIRQIEQDEIVTRVETRSGTFYVDETVSEILDRYYGRVQPILRHSRFSAESDSSIDRVTTGTTSSESAANETIGPSLKDLFDKLSIAATEVVKAVAPGTVVHNEGGKRIVECRDWDQEPVSQLIGFTVDQLAAVEGSSVEIAQQILHWTIELLNQKDIGSERN